MVALLWQAYDALIGRPMMLPYLCKPIFAGLLLSEPIQLPHLSRAFIWPHLACPLRYLGLAGSFRCLIFIAYYIALFWQAYDIALF